MPILILSIIFILVGPASYIAPSNEEILLSQHNMEDLPAGERIAFWAQRFVGAPYDPDPQGAYVTKKLIVTDDSMDCMYHTFRSVELAISNTPVKAVDIAIEKRFITRGIIDKGGTVLNYEERFQYAEDMLRSGKWGKDITNTIGKTDAIEGSRGIPKIRMLSKETLLGIRGRGNFKDGDIVYFVKDPKKRAVGEIIGHIGILSVTSDGLYLIHASGRKNKGGEVKRVNFKEYIRSMPFIGIMAGRID